MKITDSFKMKFDSKSVNESFARAAIAAFIARLDPTLEELNDIKTAVSEAVTNCIVHAYPNQLGEIQVTVKLYDNNSLSIAVRDSGCGIADIALAKTPLYTTGGSERSGMGFTVMESFMDKLKITSKPSHGTTVTMVKKITPKE